LGGKAVALAAASGGCLYVMGWSYANNIFRLWGIPLVSLNISRDYFLSYGVVAIQNEPLWFVFFSLVVLACAAFVYTKHVRNRGLERTAWGLVFLFLIIFVGSSYFGRWSGERSFEAQRLRGFVDLNRAVFLMNTNWLKDESSSRAAHLRRELTELGCYRIVFVGSETVWAARPFNGLNGEPSAEPPAVLGLPSKSIDAMRIMIGRENCD
jgi:hypothetical protein